MSEVHARSVNLKLDLSYSEWELIGNTLRTMSIAVRGKIARPTTPPAKRHDLRIVARETARLTLVVEDILAAMRAEGHV